MKALHTIMKKLPPLPILILSIIAIPLFLLDWIYYVLEVYLQYIDRYPLDPEVYLASGFRFICRLGYVVSFIGLLMMRRWGFYMGLGIWLSQLIPSFIYFAINGLNLLDQLYSGVQLLIYLSVVLPYWEKLKPISSIRNISIFLIVALVLHSVIYFLVTLKH